MSIFISSLNSLSMKRSLSIDSGHSENLSGTHEGQDKTSFWSSDDDASGVADVDAVGDEAVTAST